MPIRNMGNIIFFIIALFLGQSFSLPCPPGWVPFGFSCYMISTRELNWNDAQKVSKCKKISIYFPCLKNCN